MAKNLDHFADAGETLTKPATPLQHHYQRHHAAKAAWSSTNRRQPNDERQTAVISQDYSNAVEERLEPEERLHPRCRHHPSSECPGMEIQRRLFESPVYHPSSDREIGGYLSARVTQDCDETRLASRAGSGAGSRSAFCDGF